MQVIETCIGFGTNGPIMSHITLPEGLHALRKALIMVLNSKVEALPI